MRIELNRLRGYVGRNLLGATHSDRPMDGSNNINQLEARYGSPVRLPPLQPFDALRPSREHVPYLGTVSLYDIGEDGGRPAELVCAFRPTRYKPQHCLWDGERLWVLGAEHIEVYDADLRSLKVIRDPWLAGNHTIAGDGRGRLLVSCSASDSVLTVDARTGDIVNAQRMPEEPWGFNYPLTRHDSVTEHYIVNDYQLTHVNCAWPWRRGILTSSKIQGAVGWFDSNAQYHELLRGFVGCHGARVRSDVEEIYFCDSCSGMLVFVDAQGTIIRRVGTDSRWLHDAIQVRGDLFALAPFDQHEVVVVNVATRETVCRIPCGDRGGPERLSFGLPQAESGASVDDDRTGVPALVLGYGPMADARDAVAAALSRQRADMVRVRDASLAAHREEVGARDAAIARLREEQAQAMSSRDRAIAELQATRASAVIRLQEEINRRDRMLGELNHAMNELQHTAGLAQVEINRRDRMLGELNHTVNELQHTVGLAQEEINRRDRMLGELNHTVNELQHAVGLAQEEINRRDRMLAEATRPSSGRGRRSLAAIAGLMRWTNDAG